MEKMRKKAVLVVFIAIFLSLNLISAINLDISSKAVSNMVITDLDEPAVFDLTIRNLNETIVLRFILWLDLISCLKLLSQ